MNPGFTHFGDDACGHRVRDRGEHDRDRLAHLSRCLGARRAYGMDEIHFVIFEFPGNDGTVRLVALGIPLLQQGISLQSIIICIKQSTRKGDLYEFRIP